MSGLLERRQAQLAEDPGNVHLLAECGELSLQAGKPAEAVSYLERALEIRPDEPVLRYNLAYALMFLARYAEAKEQLLPIAQAMPQAALLLVRAHHHLGELHEALQLAEKHAAGRPEDAEASGQLAMLYLDAKDFDKARAWSEKALALPGSPPEAYSTAAFLALGFEDDARAAELVDKALELNPASGRAWAAKGIGAMYDGRLAEAEQALRRATQRLPRHIGTWLTLAWCQILLGKVDAAEASVRKAYDLDRTFNETHGALAVLQLLRGDRSGAERRAETALRLDADSIGGRYAKVLLEAKDDRARAEGMRAILSSRRTLKGNTLLDLAARRAGRRS